MARIGVDQELDFTLFTSPHVDLAKALEDDCNGFLFLVILLVLRDVCMQLC